MADLTIAAQEMQLYICDHGGDNALFEAVLGRLIRGAVGMAGEKGIVVRELQ